MKDLITLAFRQVRGIRNIYLPEESSRIFLNIVQNLQEVLATHHVDHVLIEGDHGSFYVMFSNDSWIGVTTDKNVNEVLIRAALERAVKFLEKHSQVEQRIRHIQRDIEEHFLSIGISAAVRKVDLSLESDSVSGEIHVSAREGRTEAVKEQVHQFLEKLFP